MVENWDNSDKQHYWSGLHARWTKNGGYQWRDDATCSANDMLAGQETEHNHVCVLVKKEPPVMKKLGDKLKNMFAVKKKALSGTETKCDYKHNFICKKPAEESLFRVSTESLSWYEAQEACITWGGHLAKVFNLTKQKKIESLIDSTDDFWIGMDSTVGGEPALQSVNVDWDDFEGKSQSKTKLIKTRECVEFQQVEGMSWINNVPECDGNRRFICEKPVSIYPNQC